jgi:hypothetical protein
MVRVLACDRPQSGDGGLKHRLCSDASAARHFENVIAAGVVVRDDTRAAVRCDAVRRSQHDRACGRADYIVAVIGETSVTGYGQPYDRAPRTFTPDGETGFTRARSSQSEVR